MDSINCRKQSVPKVSVCPCPLKNYDVILTEDGTEKLVEVEPVRAGLASEFNVVNNAIQRRHASSRYRKNVDPVDLENYVNDNF